MAFGSFDKGPGAPMAEINTTPLVDVMLVLLVVFIITAPLLTQAVKVDLPKAAASAHEDKPEAIRLAIKAEGQLFWNDQPVTESELPARFAAATQAGRDAFLAGTMTEKASAEPSTPVLGTPFWHQA